MGPKVTTSHLSRYPAVGAVRERPSRERDLELVLRVRDGDRAAFQELVEAYQEQVIRLAYQIVRVREEAEDVAQESFVKAYLSIADFRQESSFASWLFRIAYHMAIDVKRRSGRVELVAVDGEGAALVDGLAGDSRQEPDSELHRRRQGEALNQAMAELSPEHRAALVLREVDGLSYEEIAEATQVSRGTVMSRLHHARKRMQERLTRWRS